LLVTSKLTLRRDKSNLFFFAPITHPSLLTTRVQRSKQKLYSNLIVAASNLKSGLGARDVVVRRQSLLGPSDQHQTKTYFACVIQKMIV
jgi:hypothetical protein